jgi:hypothetical protein
LRWLHEHPGVPEEPAFELSKRLREYQVPIYVVETDDERVVREVFERTNSTGKRLEASEIFDGRFRGVSNMQPEGLRDVVDALGPLGFGRLDGKEIYAMMAALGSTDPTKVETTSWTDEVAQASLVTLLDAARRAIDFLMQDAEVPHRSLLPYALPLPTLARLFAYFPTLEPRNRELVRRWFWRGSAAELLGGATVRTRATLEAVRAGDEDASVQTLLQTVADGRDVAFDPLAGGFNARHARSRVTATALWSLRPRHLLTGELLQPDEAPVTAVLGGSGGQRSGVGNRVLHPALKGGLRRALLRCRDERVLSSHLVDAAALARLAAGDGDGFIERRQWEVAALARAFVAARTRWDETDRPPLRALWREDEAA